MVTGLRASIMVPVLVFLLFDTVTCVMSVSNFRSSKVLIVAKSVSISIRPTTIRPSGKIYAVDKDPNAISLSEENLAKFNIKNATVIHADGKDAVKDLPKVNAIFIGGTGGDTGQIITECVKKLLPEGRIVVGLILIETLFATIKTFEDLKFETDITQVTVSKSRKTSTGTMMLARNPVTIISAQKPSTMP